MRKRGVLLSLVVLLSVGGCTNQWLHTPESLGVLRVVVRQEQSEVSSIVPKLIPEVAEKIRVRVWHPNTGFNIVATVSLNDQAVDIAVPQDEGYTVDVVSYYLKDTRALALTGGSTQEVSVKANETTNVQVGLQPWHAEITSDERVKPDMSYALELVTTDAGGLITREIFESASLHASTTSFQDPDDTLPAEPGIYGILFDDRITFMATAPNVSEVSPLFVGVLVEFTQNWRDNSLENVDERTLLLELPNRHLKAPLHQLIIDPSTGGIVIDISSEERE